MARNRDAYFKSPNPHRLYKNKREGKIAGVCAGIGDYFGIDPLWVRLAAILALFMFGPMAILAYVVLAVVLSPRPEQLYAKPEDEKFWRTVTIKPDVSVAEVHHRFRDIDRRVADMEKYVSSKEYELNRAINDLKS